MSAIVRSGPCPVLLQFEMPEAWAGSADPAVVALQVRRAADAVRDGGEGAG